MIFESDLQFLCDILKKCHIDTRVVSRSDPLSSALDERFLSLFGAKYADTVEGFIGKIAPRTLYRISESCGFSYTCLLLDGQDVLFIGPYLTEPHQKEKLFEFAGTAGISQKNLRYLNEYYSSMQVILPSSHILSVIGTFCERIWETPSFAIVDVTGESAKPLSPISDPSGVDETLVEMRTIEMRYKFENELMEAVSLGQIHKESFLHAAFSEPFFEKRVPDALRNVKNYGIIMNTLLRKAAQKGGVHPIYLDSMSSNFARKIEQLTAVDESFGLMCDMFRSYCRLVRKHSMKDFSPTVQKTMLLIDADLTADLSLSALAARQNISSGYLSSVFKKETGKTLSEYIREKRIDYARHLLSTTHLQIQTVASSCGIMDVQYFSKLFRRQTGKSPKEYRRSIKK
ncbi:MAG: AraC family transcriptional regulator [Ruminococcaceae bacterium]|nr:AraC family transcriptional regulator [Oscillospiraceae bacterium]